MKRIKFSITLGHLTNFFTNFFLISENSLKFANFFAEVTNSRSMEQVARQTHVSRAHSMCNNRQSSLNGRHTHAHTGTTVISQWQTHSLTHRRPLCRSYCLLIAPWLRGHDQGLVIILPHPHRTTHCAARPAWENNHRYSHDRFGSVPFTASGQEGHRAVKNLLHHKRFYLGNKT